MNKKWLSLLILALGSTAAAGGYFLYSWPHSSTRLSNISGEDAARSQHGDAGIRAATKEERTRKVITKPKVTASIPPTFDVVNIVKDGGSVFAGTAEPNSIVSVLANGILVGKVKAEASGEWVLVVDRKFPSKDYELKLSSIVNDKQIVLGSTIHMTISDSPQVKSVATDTVKTPTKVSDHSNKADSDSRSIQKREDRATASLRSPQKPKSQIITAPQASGHDRSVKSAKIVSTLLVKKLEELVKAAKQENVRTQKKKKIPPSSGETIQIDTPMRKSGETYAVAAKAPLPTDREYPNHSSLKGPEFATPLGLDGTKAKITPGKKTVKQKTTIVSAAPRTGDVDIKVAPVQSTKIEKQVTVPIPIKFVYRKATFTPDGLKAVELLLSYVKLKKFDAITLSGHADPRGTDQHNMTLSERRLQAVTRFLKEGGFQGRVVLVPKGESDPFVGVDRNNFPIEELYQLDRRVELHFSE